MNLTTIKKELDKHEPAITFAQDLAWLRSIKPKLEAASPAEIAEYLQREIAGLEGGYLKELLTDWLAYLDTDYPELKMKWGWENWDAGGLVPQLDPDNPAFVLSIENDKKRR